MRLFADRAAAVSPDFTVDGETRPLVTDIVRRLDGLPLAIELAAARLRTLPLAEVSRRLADRFRLLTGGSRTALPRHRTLRAVVEWSWELLTRSRIETALYRIRKVSTVSATIADLEPEMPATEYRIRPSDAATSTMQTAMKIVEMRIMSCARLP